MALKRSTLLVIVAVLAAFSAGNPAAADSPKLDIPAILSYAQSVLEMYGTPGVGIAIVQNGETIYTGGLGVRNTADKTPVEADTAFQIGSITKSFTALAALILISEGKLDLDAPVITYLPDFKLADPEATKALTMRHLLSHASGLPGADDRWYSGGLTTREMIIADMVNIPLTAKPGEIFQYCNQNYVLAGYLVEKISGQGFEEFVTERILKPLGMKSAGFEMSAQANHADPHWLWVIEGAKPIPPFPAMQPIAAAGGVVANAVDMARYIQYQLGTGAPLLPPELFAQMHAATIPIRMDAPFPGAKYGLGWARHAHDGADVITHNGSIDGYYANVTILPQIDSGFALLANEQGLAPAALSAIAYYIGEALYGLPHNPAFAEGIAKEVEIAAYQANRAKAAAYDASQDDYTPLLGDYTTLLGPVRIELRGKELWAIVGGSQVLITPFEKYTFLSNGVGASASVFKFEVNGSVVRLLADGTPLGVLTKPATTPAK